MHYIHSLMKLSPSWEAANCAATQYIPSILWNPKVHYRAHKSLPPVPTLSQINPIHTIPSYLRSILILFTHIRLGLPSGLFLSGLTTNILYPFFSSPFVLHALSIYLIEILARLMKYEWQLWSSDEDKSKLSFISGLLNDYFSCWDVKRRILEWLVNWKEHSRKHPRL
jgi:hypothetical protein